MADNPNIDPSASSAQSDGGGQEPDYKAMYEQVKSESRKWEERAKANKDKADELDRLKAGDESVVDRLSKLEAKYKAMKDEKARQDMVSEIASETGLPVERVSQLNGSDKETLLAQAQELAKYIDSVKPKGAPNAPEAGTFPRDSVTTNKSASEQFSDLLEQMLR